MPYKRSYGNQALILQAWGRLDEALELLNKVETISHWISVTRINLS